MRSRVTTVALALAALVIVAGSAHAWMKEGVTRGTIVVVGEDRLVVQSQEGGQVTFEVAMVKVGDQWVKSREQMELIRNYKPGQRVEVAWGQDHTGHSFIVSTTRLNAAGVPVEGRVLGAVVTVGELNLVIQKAEGGQMTLEPGWLGGGRGRNREQIAFFQTLKPGDPIAATWVLDEGTHYCVTTIVKLGPDGKPIVAAAQPEPLNVQIRALRGEIDVMRHEIARLRQALTKLLEAK